MKTNKFRKIWIAGGLVVTLLLLALLALFLLNFFLPQELSPYEAHYNTDDWVGRQVRVSGWLRRFEGSNGPHYAVEDEQKNRVGLRDFDEATLKPLLDKRITIEGQFNYDEIYGIHVVVKKLSAAP